MRLEYFQLLSRVTDLDLAGKTIRAQADVPHTSTIFEGHFPGRPLMPGVLLIEAMAQASGWLLIAANRFERMPFLAAVKEAKLRSFVSPGDVLMLSASIVHEGSGFAMTKAAGEVVGKTVCDAEITFRIMPFPDAKFRASMEAFGQAIGFPLEAPTHG
jgi:3-hydroxyacyl-[acyl-carrier-protein] dehydratase